MLISETFHTLRPSFLPGFTFAWVSLISHRLFMSKLLLAPERRVGELVNIHVCIEY
jgi:CCR4-NOT transcription complex subunit 1